MYVKIGPYSHWFQPATWFKNWILWWYGLNEITWLDRFYKKLADASHDTYDVETYEKIIEWIRTLSAYKLLSAIEQWVDARTKRKIVVRVHDYDVWGMDHTLALIVAPLLNRLKAKQHGAPFVDDDDVPEELRSTSAPPVGEYETDANHFKRWNWVIDEMIWAFEQIKDDDNDRHFFVYPDPNDLENCQYDKDGYLKHQQRIDRGVRLFGKYFRGLWD